MIPPGNASFPLSGALSEFYLVGFVGSSNSLGLFRVSTLIPDVVVPTSNTSITYVATGRNGNISLPSYYGFPNYVTGPVAYENFTFGELTIQGQSFLNHESGVSVTG